MATVSYTRIRSNLVYLVKNLSVDHLRPLMMEENLITHEEHRKLANSRWSEQEKAEELLISILPRKGNLGLEVFVKCLIWSGQLEAARKLSVSEDDIKRFISENPHKLEGGGLECGVLPLRESGSVNYPAIGGPVFVLYASQHEGDRCDPVNKLIQYLSCLSVTCVCDLLEQRAVHIQDWSAWVVEKMRLCCENHGHVLVVSSGVLARSLQSGVSQDVQMRRGKFNSLAVTNLLAQADIVRRSIPVFLDGSKMLDWVPACLQGKTSFLLNIREFHTQLGGNLSPENVKQLAKLSCFRDFHDLSTFLVGSPKVHSSAASSATECAVSSKGLTDSELRIVAEGVARDWKVLAEKLSVRETVLRSVVEEHPNHDVEQAYRMLRAWRDSREEATGQSLSAVRQELKGSLRRNHWQQLAEQL